MSGKSALLIGATGAVGKHVLRELISSGEFTRVLEAGRRVTPLDQLPPSAKEKLEQKTVDFEKINEAGLREGKWDVVFITYVFYFPPCSDQAGADGCEGLERQRQLLGVHRHLRKLIESKKSSTA